MIYRDYYKKPDLDVINYQSNFLDGRSDEEFEKHLKRLYKMKQGLIKKKSCWHKPYNYNILL